MSAQRRYRSVRAVTEGTESDWQRTITDCATLRGWRWAHIPDSRRKSAGDKGFPDLVLARGEQLIFVEVKRPRGKVSAEQWAWIFALGAVNGRISTYVWRPKDWSSIEEILR